MKKIFSAAIISTIISTIIISASCATAFASDYEAGELVTPQTFSEAPDDGSGDSDINIDIDKLPDETVPLDDGVKLQMAREYAAQYGVKGDPEKFTVLCFKKLSNGMELVFVESDEWEYSEVLCTSRLGKYDYTHTGGRSVKLYKDGVYTDLYSAYIDGVIDDEIVEEINGAMHFELHKASEEPDEPDTTVFAEEPQPEDTPFITDEKTTESATAPQSEEEPTAPKAEKVSDGDNAAGSESVSVFKEIADSVVKALKNAGIVKGTDK